MTLTNIKCLIELSDDSIQRSGKYIVAIATAYYIIKSIRSVVPADAKYAIEAHMPQGYDRSLIAARLEQRHTKGLLMKHLPLAKLRDDLRLEMDRQEKLRLWTETLHLTLTGILAASYIHTLTITLFTLKNTVRVLIFLLRRREEEMLQRKGLVPGAISKLRAWWVNGTKAVMMEKVIQLMSRGFVQETSPFGNSGLDDEVATSWQMLPPPYGDPAALEGGGFSVGRILSAAVPRIVKSARCVVTHAFKCRPSHLFSATNVVTRGELRKLFDDLAAGMERCVGVAAWTNLVSPLPSAAMQGCARAGTCDGGIDDLTERSVFGSLPQAPNDAGEVNDVFEFPAGSTAMLGHDGKLVHPRVGAYNSRVGTPVHGNSSLENSSSERLRLQKSVETVDFLGPSASLSVGETAMATLERERQIKEQSTGFFKELLDSISVKELVLDHAAEVLNQNFRDILENLSNVKSYDVATDSVKMLMFIASLEAPRQRLYDAEFEIKSYLRLFCEETVRSTCSQ